MKADSALGASFLKRDDESLYDYVVSFSPLAPLVGVPYRFGEMFKMPSSFFEMPGMPAPMAAPFKAATEKPAAKPKAIDPSVVDPKLPPTKTSEPKASEPKASEPKASGPKAEKPAEDEAPVAKVNKPKAEAVAPKAAASVATAVRDKPAAKPKKAKAAPAPKDGSPALLYASAPETADDLKLIKGVGPKLEKELNAMGLFTFAQISSLTADNLVWIDEKLTSFKGRSTRDDWIGQAAALLDS